MENIQKPFADMKNIILSLPSLPTLSKEEQEKIELQEKEQRRQEILADKFGSRFKTASFDNLPINETQKQAIEICRQNFDKKSLFLTGNYGIGKTHLLAAIYRECGITGIRRRYFAIKELAEWFRNAELDGGVSREIKALRKDYAIFIIDDIDKIKLTEFFEDAFFTLIDYLYQDEKIIHISSNKSFKELVESGFSGATIRRLQDISIAVRF